MIIEPLAKRSPLKICLWLFVSFVTASVLLELWKTPRYQGRSIDAWFDTTMGHTNVFRHYGGITLEQWATGVSTDERPLTELRNIPPTPSIRAFRHFGSEGTKFLARRLSYSPSWYARNYGGITNKLPAFTHQFLPRIRPPGEELIAALYLLEHLGPTAADAAPTLITQLDSTPFPPAWASNPHSAPKVSTLLSIAPDETSIRAILSSELITLNHIPITRLLAKPRHATALSNALLDYLRAHIATNHWDLVIRLYVANNAAPKHPATKAFTIRCFREFGIANAIGYLAMHQPDLPWLIDAIIAQFSISPHQRYRHPKLYPLGLPLGDPILALQELLPHRIEEIQSRLHPLLSITNRLHVRLLPFMQKIARTYPDRIDRTLDLTSIKRIAAQGNRDTRLEASVYLHLLGMPEPLVEYLRIVKLKADPYQKAVLCLKELHTAAATNALTQIARSARTPKLRIEAIYQLGEIGANSIPVLLQFGQSADFDIRHAAYDALSIQKRFRPQRPMVLQPAHPKSRMP